MDILALIQAQYQKGLPTLNGFYGQMQTGQLFLYTKKILNKLHCELSIYLSWQHCHSLFVTTLCILIGASYLHNGLDRHKNDLMTPICIEMDPWNDISWMEGEWE